MQSAPKLQTQLAEHSISERTGEVNATYGRSYCTLNSSSRGSIPSGGGSSSPPLPIGHLDRHSWRVFSPCLPVLLAVACERDPRARTTGPGRPDHLTLARNWNSSSPPSPRPGWSGKGLAAWRTVPQRCERVSGAPDARGRCRTRKTGRGCRSRSGTHCPFFLRNQGRRRARGFVRPG